MEKTENKFPNDGHTLFVSTPVYRVDGGRPAPSDIKIKGDPSV